MRLAQEVKRMICRPIRVLTTSGEVSSEIGEVSKQGADQFLANLASTGSKSIPISEFR
jgi:hypothetical protein